MQGGPLIQTHWEQHGEVAVFSLELDHVLEPVMANVQALIEACGEPLSHEAGGPFVLVSANVDIVWDERAVLASCPLVSWSEDSDMVQDEQAVSKTCRLWWNFFLSQTPHSAQSSGSKTQGLAVKCRCSKYPWFSEGHTHDHGCPILQ